MHLKDRTFLISGGSSGLGLATALDFASRGAYISILDLNRSAGEAAVKQIGSDRALFFECDVTSTSSVGAAVNGTVEWVKKTGKALGGVLAAAGVGLPAKIIDRDNNPVSIETIDFVLNINLRGTLDLIRLAVPHLTTNEPLGPEGERGVLVLVSSSAAFDGQPGQVAYAASKGAIRSLTLPLARDLARYGIRAVTIAPSLFESNMTKQLPERARKSLERVMEFPVRAGKPEEFARVVRESVENIMLNGTVIRLDGAMRMPSKM